MIPQELKYTKDHEWIKVEGDVLTLGITEHAQKELGDVTYIDLPGVDQDVDDHGDLVVIESVKAAADVYAPVAGVVSAVNEALEDAPELVNTAPYGDGWLCKLSGFAQSDVDALMSAADYEAFLNE